MFEYHTYKCEHANEAQLHHDTNEDDTTHIRDFLTELVSNISSHLRIRLLVRIPCCSEGETP